MNGISVSVTFDGKTALVNGEVVTASKEGSTVMIICKEMSVTFDGSDVVVNNESYCCTTCTCLMCIF